jgi:hypothetical protein
MWVAELDNRRVSPAGLPPMLGVPQDQAKDRLSGKKKRQLAS